MRTQRGDEQNGHIGGGRRHKEQKINSNIAPPLDAPHMGGTALVGAAVHLLETDSTRKEKGGLATAAELDDEIINNIPMAAWMEVVRIFFWLELGLF